MTAPIAGLVAATLLAVPIAPGAAQPASERPRLVVRTMAGFLNQDDPLDWEFALSGEVGADFRDRLGVVARVVGQGRVDNPGRAGPVPEHRVVAAVGLEYAPASRSRFGEQFRARLSGGVMIRQGVASAPVVSPGFLIRYRMRVAPIVLVLVMEDMVTFLPTEEFASPATVDAKIEHNFLAVVGLEVRL